MGLAIQAGPLLFCHYFRQHTNIEMHPLYRSVNLRMTFLVTPIFLKKQRNLMIFCPRIKQLKTLFQAYYVKGGFQLEFVSISQVINHMTCYKFFARFALQSE